MMNCNSYLGLGVLYQPRLWYQIDTEPNQATVVLTQCGTKETFTRQAGLASLCAAGLPAVQPSLQLARLPRLVRLRKTLFCLLPVLISCRLKQDQK